MSQNERKSKNPAAGNAPWYTARIWVGSDFFGFLRLLSRHKFRTSPSRFHIAMLDLAFGAVHSTLRGVQHLVYGNKIARCELAEDPIFILGHWRTGTTLLHELLILDERHRFPTTYECFAPNHFLITERFLKPCLGWALPPERPMDHMALGWDRPQEDEFALCNMGLPSPYLTIAFPNDPPEYEEYLDLVDVPPRDLARWKEGFLHFIKSVTYNKPGRLVLKSPPHTARVRVLNEMFPRARYVHLVRDPFVVFSSTMHLWKSLYNVHGLQVPTCEHLEEYVFDTFVRMHERYEEDKALIPPGQLLELRYEDLIADPLSQVRSIYEQLDLGDFAQVEPRVRAYLDRQSDYRTNRYQISPELRDKILQRWGSYIRKYGYTPPPCSPPLTAPELTSGTSASVA